MARNSILCPNCGKIVSLDELHCPYCRIKRPGSWLNRMFSLHGSGYERALIRAVIGVNFGMFLLSLLIYPFATGLTANPFSALSPAFNSLLELGMTGSIPLFSEQKWWTLITAGYLHGGILHLLFNMAAITQLAPLIAKEYGVHRMFIIYTVSGIIGFLVSGLAGVKFTIGASASLCGLIGAALYYGKSRGGTYGGAIYRQVGTWAIMIVVFGIAMPGINNYGHLGGIAGGAMIAWLIGYHEKRREGIHHKYLSLTCIGLTMLALGIGLYYGLLTKIPG